MLDIVQSQPSTAAQTVEGTIKWFSIPKSYGFIELPGRPDVLLHIARLHESGLGIPQPGARVSCDVVDRNGKLSAIKVHSIDGVQIVEAPRRELGPRVSLDDTAVEATVKLFKRQEGYGILEQPNGLPDIFIHCTTLRKCGIEVLSKGQKVRVTTVLGDRGLKASQIALV